MRPFILLLFVRRINNFPSFSEGLSLRQSRRSWRTGAWSPFPFLFGGTFIEATSGQPALLYHQAFPFLFGGTFIEASSVPLNGERIKFPFLFGGTFIEATLEVF